MSTQELLKQYEENDDTFSARREASARIPQRSYSPRHQRRHAKSANLRNGAHRKRQKLSLS